MRKPGALANYRFREEMFPTSQFRIAYDMLHEAHAVKVADKTYVKLLEMAARISQDAVADALRVTITAGHPVVDCQAGLAVAEVVSATSELRGLNHRRSGLCPTEPRRNGGSVHAVGRTLRTRQRVVDQQLGIQQVGPDIQGYNDDGSSDRSTGSPQRDHRTQRSQLPSRNSQEVQHFARITQAIAIMANFFTGNSNCR